MKILILEDDENRVEIFRRQLIGFDVVYVDRASDAIKWLSEDKFDYLFLDHDLGGKVFVEETENTGYEVCLWLEENPEKKPEHIFLHSLNPNGRERMKQAVPDAIDAVFAWKIAGELIAACESGLVDPPKNNDEVME